MRSLDDHQRRGDFNLLVLSIDTGGGDLDESQRLAEHLAELDAVDSHRGLSSIGRRAAMRP